jgi:hypothetical protein
MLTEQYADLTSSPLQYHILLQAEGLVMGGIVQAKLTILTIARSQITSSSSLVSWV